MASGRLVSSVYVLDDKGAGRVFGPGDDVPKWAALKMGAHCFEGGVHPYPGGGAAAAVEGPPAKAGPGSSKAAWLAYAAGHGVELDGEPSREDIIAALDAAGIATE